ncbi:MAG: peptidylprolyl isomerase [Bdellovibrionota bacterium]
MVIRSMREAVSSWYIRVLLVVLVLSFVSFYGWQSVMSGGLDQGVLAKVNGNKVLERDVNLRVSNRINEIQNNPAYGSLDKSFFQTLIPTFTRQVTEALVEVEIKADAAEDLGIEASDEKVREFIRSQFTSSDQKFNYELYEMIVKRRMGKTPRAYEKEMARILQAQYFDEVLQKTTLVSPIEVKKSYEQQNTKYAITTVEVDADKISKHVPKASKPTDEQLSAFYQENKDRYQTPEKKQLEILWIEKTADQEEEAFFSQAQIKLQGWKDQNKGFETATQYEGSPMYLKTPLIAYGEKIDLFSERDVTDLLNASLGLQVGEISSPTRSRDGLRMYLIKVVQKQDPVLPAFDEVAQKVEKDVEKQLQEKEEQLFVTSMVSKAAQEKTSVDALGKTYGLNVSKIEAFVYPVDGTIPELGQNKELVSAVFSQTEKGYLSQVYSVGDKQYIVYVHDISLPDWTEFESKKQELADLLEKENSQNRISAWTQFLKEHSSIEYSAKLQNSDFGLGL